MMVQISENFYNEIKHNRLVQKEFIYNNVLTNEDIMECNQIELERRLGQSDFSDLSYVIREFNDVDFLISYRGQNEAHTEKSPLGDVADDDWSVEVSRDGRLFAKGIATINVPKDFIGYNNPTTWIPDCIIYVE